MRGARSDESAMTPRTSDDESIEAGRAAWRVDDGNGERDGWIKSLRA
jgi:hypothetical protein